MKSAKVTELTNSQSQNINPREIPDPKNRLVTLALSYSVEEETSSAPWQDHLEYMTGWGPAWSGLASIAKFIWN